MAIGRLIERLFIQVKADLSSLGTEMREGVRMTKRGTDQMVGDWAKVETALGQYKREIRSLSRSMNSEAMLMGRAMSPIGRGVRRGFNTAPIQAFARSTGQARMQMLNLGYQMNDVGMTLATGMNPLTVLIQQGSQIVQIYAGQGGVRTALGDISRMLSGIAKKLWPIAAIAAGFALLTREINKTTETSVSFMDTFKAVFQVMGKSIAPVMAPIMKWLRKAWDVTLDYIVARLKSWFNFFIRVNVGIVKIAKNVWDLLPGLWHDSMTAIKNTSLDVTEAIVNFFIVTIPRGVVMGVNKMVQAMVFGFRAISAVWSALPSMMQDAIGGAVNFVVDGAEKMVNAAVKGIQKLVDAINGLIEFVGGDKALEFFGFSGKIPPLKESDLQEYRMQTGNSVSDLMSDIGDEAAKTFNQNFMEGITLSEGVNLQGQKGAMTDSFSELGRRIKESISSTMGTDFMGDFFEAVKDQAVTNALARIAAGVEDIGGAAKGAAEEVKELMEQLDEQLTTSAENLAGVFGAAFERLADTGRLTFGDFIKDLNKLIIKSTSEMLQQELANMFKQLAMSQGGLGGIASNLFTGLFGGGLPGRAVGGVEMPWRSFIAGEHGGELITQDGPAGARHVSTAGRTKQLMSGSRGASVNVTMNIQTPDAESFRKSQSQIAGRMGGFISKGRRNG